MFRKSLHQQEYKILRCLEDGLSEQQISNLFSRQEPWGIYLLSLPLKNLAVNAMERYERTFTIIVRIFQIHQHWTLHKRICCCWTIAFLVSRIKPKRTTLEVDTTIAIRYPISDYLDIQFEKIHTLLSCSHKT